MSGSAPPGSLAFNNPSQAKVDQQRKILAELERQKKLLDAKNSPGDSSPGAKADKTPASSPASSTSAPPASSSVVDPLSQSPLLSSNQRSALEQAAKTSFGYFIAQDSSFGNTILPVIPRFDNGPTTGSSTSRTPSAAANSSNNSTSAKANH